MGNKKDMNDKIVLGNIQVSLLVEVKNCSQFDISLKKSGSTDKRTISSLKSTRTTITTHPSEPNPFVESYINSKRYYYFLDGGLKYTKLSLFLDDLLFDGMETDSTVDFLVTTSPWLRTKPHLKITSTVLGEGYDPLKSFVVFDSDIERAGSSIKIDVMKEMIV